MTLKGVRTSGAFGLFNRQLSQTGEDLRKAFCKARELALQQSMPTTRKFPLSSLRRRVSNILGLDVIFIPRMIKVDCISQNPRSRVPIYYKWEVSPVWKTAPRGAVKKAAKLSSLLHTIVTDGWKCSNIVHDLVRLATQVWQMPMRHFNGLCRSIFSKIVKVSCEDTGKKSPDPVLQFSLLSTNPIANYYRVSRYENRSRLKNRGCGVTRLPYDLRLRGNILSTAWYKTHLRHIGLRQKT